MVSILSYDYLGLGKPRKQKNNFDTNFIDLNSDYTGLGHLAGDIARDTGKARRYVNKEAKQYRKDIQDIKKEAKEFKDDFKGGGWLGRYIQRKRLENKQSKPKKFSHRF